MSPPLAGRRSSLREGSTGPAAPQNRPRRDTTPWTLVRLCNPAKRAQNWLFKMRQTLSVVASLVSRKVPQEENNMEEEEACDEGKMSAQVNYDLDPRLTPV